METQCRYRTHRHCYSDTSVLCLSKSSTWQMCKRSNSDSGQLEIYSHELYFDRNVQTGKKSQMTKQTETIARCCRLFQVNRCCLEVQKRLHKKLKLILALLYFCLILGQNFYNVHLERDRKHFEQDKISKTFELADLLRFHKFSLSVETVMPSNMDKYFNSMAKGQGQRINDSMSVEMLRIYSLRNFPRNINISMVRLARAGFYSTGNSTETRCFRCGVIYRDWISGDDPINIHRRISPTCDLFVNGNRHDTIGEELQTVRRQEQREVQPSYPNGLTTGHITLQSNKNIGSSNILSSGRYDDNDRDLTSSARHCHHHDTVEDQTTDISLPGAQSHDSHTNSNKTLTSNCKNNSQNISAKNNSTASHHESGPSYNHEGLQNPRYINYAPLQVRISSYEGWPGYLNQTPREMALAGFLFAGYNDYTRCFHCGGGLRNWEAGDDPWVEHARWFPQCGFLKQNKGEKFIQAVLKKHNMDQKTNENSSYSHKQSQEYRTVTSDKNTTTASTSGLQQNYMCESSLNVQEQANNLNSEERSDITTPLDIQTVISTSNNSTITASGVNISSSSVAATNIIHNQQGILQTVAARTVIEMGFSGQQVVDAVNEIERLNSGEGGTNISAVDIMNVLLREDHQQSGQVLNVPETVTTEGMAGASFDDTHLILEENRQLQEQRQCKVCKEFDSTVAFLPCGHIVCCTDCAPAMRKCPVCKTYVKGTVKTFLA